jgi:hypothetical protein
MNGVEGIQKLCEDILNSYGARVTSIAELVKGTERKAYRIRRKKRIRNR